MMYRFEDFTTIIEKCLHYEELHVENTSGNIKVIKKKSIQQMINQNDTAAIYSITEAFI